MTVQPTAGGALSGRLGLVGASSSSADRRKRLALVAAIMGSFVAGLDATAVNVALPAIRVDLGGGLAGQQWISNAYLLALGSLILVGGSLGDIFGERRVFSIGVAGFGLVSLLCATAPSIGFLIAVRALQGAFGALLTPSALAVIIAAFPRAERGAAIGSWTAWAGIATVIGPLAGGYLVDASSWRLIFAINIPFVAVTLLLISLAVPARAPGTRHARVDWLGAALTFLGLAGPVLALIRQPIVGWGSPEVWGPGLAGPVLLGLFLVHERRTAAPMLPLGLFKRRNFAVGNVQTFAMYGGLGVTFFLLVLFLQEVAGYTALQAGLALMPSTIVMFLLSKRAGRLADRLGPHLFMGFGPLTAALGLALMLRLDARLNYFTDLLPALLIFSVGLACTIAPLTATVLSDADESNAGIASGINNAIARIGGLLAIAAIGAVISSQFSAKLDQQLAGRALSPAAQAAVAQARSQTLARVNPAVAGPEVSHAVQSASVHAFDVGIGIAATLVALGGLLGLAGIRNPRRTVRCEDCAGGQLAGQPLITRRRRPSPAAHPLLSGGTRTSSLWTPSTPTKEPHHDNNNPRTRVESGPIPSQPASWTFEFGHTEAGFRARHMMVTSVHGLFKDVHGQLRMDLNDPLSASFSGEIDAAKIWTGERDRDAHLRSADFFDVENHPKIAFAGRLVERTGDTNFKAEADLTIRGITRKVTLDVAYLGQWKTPFWDGDENRGTLTRIGFEATTRINRHDFAVSWQDNIPGGGVVVSNEIEVTLDIEAILDADLEATGAIDYYRPKPTS